MGQQSYGRWRKSTRSGSGAQCVELDLRPTTAALRDSKNPDGPILTFSAPAWHRFLAAAKNDELTRPETYCLRRL
jgi:hypothetical protein